MPPVRVLRTSFNGGKISPLMDSRIEVEKVTSGLRESLNMLPLVQGPLTRRPGFQWLANLSATKQRLYALNYSETEAFVLVCLNSSFQVWQNGVQIANPSPDVEPAPWVTGAAYAVADRVAYGGKFYAATVAHTATTQTPAQGNVWTVPGTPIVRPQLYEDISVSTSPAAITSGTTCRWIGRRWTALVAVAMIPIPRRTPARYMPSVAPGDNAAVWRDDGPDILEWAIGLQYPSGSIVEYAGVNYTTAIEHIASESNKPGTLLNAQWSELTGLSFITSVYAPFLAERETQMVQINDVCWFVHPDFPPHRLLRIDSPAGSPVPYSFVIQPVEWDWPATLDENVSEVTITPSVIKGTGTLTASAPIFKASHVGSFWQIAHRRDYAFTEIRQPANPATTNGGWPASGGGQAFSGVSSPVLILGRYTVTTWGTWSALLFLERSKSKDGPWETVTTWKRQKDGNVNLPFVAEAEEWYRLRVADGNGEEALGVALPRFTLEAADSKVYGFVKVTAYTSPTSVSMTVVKDLWEAAATRHWSEGAWSAARGYPRAVQAHGERLWFAGHSARPQAVYGSNLGDFESFRRTGLDTGSLSLILASRDSHMVQWMAPMDGHLVIGTTGQEWSLSSPEGGGTVTPTAYQLRDRSTFGSHALPALPIQTTLLFTQSGGTKVRRLSYDGTTQGRTFVAPDVTTLSEDILMKVSTASGITQGLRDWAIMNRPHSIVWMVTAEGKLVSLTFEQEQNVFAWAEHSLPTSLIRSMCVVKGPVEDELWVISQWGSGGGRYLLRLGFSLAPKFHADYWTSAATSGWPHEASGEKITIAAGLPTGDAKAVKSLCRFMPTRIEVPTDRGSSQHQPAKLSRINFRTQKSAGSVKIIQWPLAEAVHGSGFVSGSTVNAPKTGKDSVSTIFSIKEGVTTSNGGAATCRHDEDAGSFLFEKTDHAPLTVKDITFTFDLHGA